jgi:hypothetical protein
MLQRKRSFAAAHRPKSIVLRDECVFSKIINYSDRFDVESSLGFSCLYWRKKVCGSPNVATYFQFMTISLLFP